MLSKLRLGCWWQWKHGSKQLWYWTSRWKTFATCPGFNWMPLSFNATFRMIPHANVWDRAHEVQKCKQLSSLQEEACQSMSHLCNSQHLALITHIPVNEILLQSLTSVQMRYNCNSRHFTPVSRLGPTQSRPKTSLNWHILVLRYKSMLSSCHLSFHSTKKIISC